MLRGIPKLADSKGWGGGEHIRLEVLPRYVVGSVGEI